MTTSPNSYLQTLADDELTAFVSSLQGVKAHLNQELQWINKQVEQKTVQLQGIETLLSEASVLGLVASDAGSISNDMSATVPSAPISAGKITPNQSDLETSVAANQGSSVHESIDSIAAAIAALPAKASSNARSGQGKSGQAKPSRSPKPSATSKTSTAKAKRSNASASKSSHPGKATGLHQFLQSQFRDKALTESVSDVLNRASAPLSTDDMMAELYDGLSEEDYQRAKHSLANILSVGKSKGSWKSTGRGRYASNTSAITA